jgi:hypothetical protein
LQIEFVFTSPDGSQTLWWESTERMFPFPRSYDIQCVESLSGFANGEFATIATNVPSEGLYTAISLLQQGASIDSASTGSNCINDEERRVGYRRKKTGFVSVKFEVSSKES